MSEANPQSLGLYNELAISYTKLGRVHAAMNEPEKTTKCFHMAEEIWLHLTQSVPEMVEYKNNLSWVKGQLESL